MTSISHIYIFVTKRHPTFYTISNLSDVYAFEMYFKPKIMF